MFNRRTSSAIGLICNVYHLSREFATVNDSMLTAIAAVLAGGGTETGSYAGAMSFDVGADAYGCFMGRYSEPLAVRFAALVEARPGQRALDVGCGPGALTAALAQRLGSGSVAAIDPSASFVSAVRERLPGVDVRHAYAEELPFPDNEFDLAVAQLVVHFMIDPVAGLAEMARVTRPGGLVAACVWDQAGASGPLATFWRAARDLDPSVRDESDLPGARDGHLVELFTRVGLDQARQDTLTVHASFPNLDAWWQPFTLGVGPAGAYVATLDPEHRDSLRDRCSQLLPVGPFVVQATAWTALART
jgi:SAM-dependent methyltransferase